jgi:3-oxoadipate enol-lactonase
MAELRTEDGVRIVYDDLGPRDGVCVVICHGLAAAGEQMRADAEYFAGLGFRVLVPDLRGHGRSGVPEPLTRESLSIARMAADLVALLDHAGVPKVHWVGNSLGGILALQMLAQHEARFRTLATFGTAYRLSLPPLGRLIPLSYRLLGPGLVARVTALATTRHKAARVLIERLVRAHDPAVGGLLASNLAVYDLIANAQRARLPILMLRGGRDGAVNAELGPSLAAMQGRDNFTLVELREGGHCANLDATDAWRAALLTFWDGR